MRILLLTPPIPLRNTIFPLGLAYIGAVLKQKGHDIKMVDTIALYDKYTKDDVKKLIRDYNPEVVGFSLIISFITDVYDFVSELKRDFKDIIFIAGGPHATALPEEVSRHGFDFVVVNEGEETIVELIDAIEKKAASFDKIKGIAYKSDAENIIITESRPLIKDLDTLPFPDRASFPIENYTNSKDPDSNPYFWIISSSRGCPFDCIYCMNTVFGKGYRFRSAENVFKEIKSMHDEYKTRYVYFIDDEFMVDKKRLYRLADLILENKLCIGWTSQARINNIDTEFIDRMTKAGLKEIMYGVESGDPTTLKEINKRMSLKDIKRGIEYTLKSQIPTFSINNMIGFPWEKRKNIVNTYRLNKSIGNKIPVSNAFWIPIPYPKTELYNRYHEKFGFTNWWLNKKYFTPEYSKDNYQPFFKRHMFFLDHPQLRSNFYKYSFFHKAFIREIFIKIWFLQASRKFSISKRCSIFIFSICSYALYLVSPALEKFITSRILKASILRVLFHIEKQGSISNFKSVKNES